MKYPVDQRLHHASENEWRTREYLWDNKENMEMRNWKCDLSGQVGQENPAPLITIGNWQVSEQGRSMGTGVSEDSQLGKRRLGRFKRGEAGTKASSSDARV